MTHRIKGLLGLQFQRVRVLDGRVEATSGRNWMLRADVENSHL